MRIGADLELAREHLLQRFHHADVAGDAAGEGDFRLQGRASRQRHGALGDGGVHPGEDVFALLAHGEIRQDVRLDKDRADGGDFHRVRAQQRHRSNLVQADPHHVGGVGEEASGAGGALVVHGKIQHLAVGADADGFGVLPAHVDHRAGRRTDKMRAAGVAGYLGHLGVAERDLVAAVPGADHKSHLARVHPRLLTAEVETVLGGLDHVGARIDDGAREDGAPAAVLLHEDRLGLGGTDINACGQSHEIPSPCAIGETRS